MKTKENNSHMITQSQEWGWGSIKAKSSGPTTLYSDNTLLRQLVIPTQVGILILLACFILMK